MGRKWWDSLSERQKEEHNLKSGLGTIKAQLTRVERMYDAGRLRPEMAAFMAHNASESCLSMEDVAKGYSLRLFMDVRETRQRAVALLVATSHPVH